MILNLRVSTTAELSSLSDNPRSSDVTQLARLCPLSRQRFSDCKSQCPDPDVADNKQSVFNLPSVKSHYFSSRINICLQMILDSRDFTRALPVLVNLSAAAWHEFTISLKCEDLRIRRIEKKLDHFIILG